MIDLSGKKALVTGASRGIGAAIAQSLDAAGAQVLLNSRNVADIERVAAGLSNNPQLLAADLAPSGAGTALAERVIAEHGGVDILINNAGIAMRRTPQELTEADVDDVLNVNVRGLLMLSVGLGDAFIERGGGSIVNISSVAGLIGPLGRVAYSASKGAVDAMTRALAADWGRHGIRVNSVAPGIITTDIWAESRTTVPGLIEKMEAGVSLRRWGSSEDVADVVLFLASDLSSYVTGETIAVDGGMAKVRGGGEPEYRS
jgi:NAD(P)-dependent dehydrogenase (short-subunit alcohol dehydrogenase family)